MEFARWMARPLGRGLRIVMGLVIVLLGFTQIDGTWGNVVAFLGLVPIAAGTLNFCLIAPLIHAPFWGRDALAGPRPGSHGTMHPA